MKDLKELLHKRNLKATPTRLNLLEIIKQYDGAVPYSSIQKKMAGADRITMFRTLNALLDNGIVHKTEFEDSETYYALCPTTCSDEGHIHNHAHFQCSSCKRVTCENLNKEINISIKNAKIDFVSVNIVGICGECLN